MNRLNHVAFIMDGNGRWGKKRNKGRNFGHFNGVETVKKIVSIPIPNEAASVSASELNKIAIKNKINSEVSNNFFGALRKISSREKKLIVCFGSLYSCGSILNKN